jgi:hypothetical protein
MGQESVIADLGKTSWEHVQKKTPDKLINADGEFFFFVVVTAISILDSYLVVIDCNNPIVGRSRSAAGL